MSDGAQDLGELRAEVRALIRMFEQHNAEELRWREDLAERLDRYSKRLRSIERSRDIVVGGILVLGAVWGAVKVGASVLAAFITGR